MPKVTAPDGTVINFPDGMSTDIMTQEMDHWWEKKSATATPQNAPQPSRPSSDMAAPTLAGKLKGAADEALSPDRTPVDALARPGQIATNVLRRGGKSLVDTVAGLPDALAHPKGFAVTQEERDAADPVQQYSRIAHDKGAEEALTDVAGDALLGTVGGKVLSAAPEAIEGLGTGLKKAGALSSRVGLGAQRPVDVMDADAGAALSNNRIVGTTPRSLGRKIAARIPEAANERNAILDQSTAGPSNVSQSVSQPFDDIRTVKTDPKTGAAQPGAIKRLSRTQSVLSHETDPQTGDPTSTPRDPNLTPREMADFQKNIYSMTDYKDPESDLANSGLKGAAANLRQQIVAASPESAEATANVHNLLGAEDVVRGKTSAPPELSKTGLLTSAVKGVKTGALTAAGAALDVAGDTATSLAQKLKTMRGGSPVAPSQPTPTAPAAPPMTPLAQLPATTTANGTPAIGRVITPPSPVQAGGSGATQGVPVPQTVVPPPPGNVARLPATTSAPLQESPVAPAPPQPTLNERTARNRTVPRAPVGEVIPPRRTLVAGPNGTQAQGLPLESSTGRRAPSAMATRPSLLRQLRGKEGVVTPAPAPVPEPVAAAPSRPSRLPGPTDIHGWEKLVDDGLAHYDVHTHSYQYDAPATSGGK